MRKRLVRTFTRVSLLALSALLAGLSATVLATTAGPDAGGYTATDVTAFSFIDVSGGGATILTGADDSKVALTLPFAFQFYGHSYPMVCVSSNGAAYFIAAEAECAAIPNDFANTDLTTATPPGDHAGLFPLWSDLAFGGAGTGVVYQSQGDAPNRKFVLQWNNAYPLSKDVGASQKPVTFQAILLEGSNQILFQYQTVDLGAGDAASNGGRATVGIRNAGALVAGPTTGQQIPWSYNSAVLADGKAILFTGATSTPSMVVTGGTFPFTGSPHAGAGHAYGVDGVSGGELSPPVTLSYAGSDLAYGPTAVAPTNPGTYEVTGTFAGNGQYTSATGTASLTITQVSQAITKTQTSGPNPATAKGQVLGYTVVVHNTGTQAQTGVTVTDTLPDGGAGTLTGPVEALTVDGVFEPNETWSYTGSYTVTQADINAGTALVNTAHLVTTEVPGPTNATATTLVTRAPTLILTKTADKLAVSTPGTITYEIKVANTGNVDLTNVVVTDPLATTGPTLGSGDAAPLGVLNVGETWVYAATHMVTQAEIDAGTALVNTARVATTEVPGPTNAVATTQVNGTKTLTITKTQTSGPNPATAKNQVLGYTLVVHNTGTTTETGVTVTDTLPGGAAGTLSGPVETLTTDGVLEPNETWTYTGSYTVTQADIDAGTSLVNTAHVATTQVPGPTDATAATPVAGTKTLTITKTQTSGPNPATAQGQVLGYTVVVHNTGTTTETGVTVTDTLPGGAAGTLGGPVETLTTNGVFEPNETWTYTGSYAVTQADIDAGTSLVNTAHVATTQVPGPTNATATTPVAGTTLAATTTTIGSSRNPANVGETVTFTATVKRTSNSSAVTSGTVTFKEGAAVLAGPTAVNGSGQASFSTSALAAGSHTVAAIYNGTVAFATSTGSVVEVVNRVSTDTALFSTANPSEFSDAVTIIAWVHAGVVPVGGGTVTFKDGATVLAANVPVSVIGLASFSTSSLGVGSHAISAEFSGNARYAPSAANLSQVVSKARTSVGLASSVNPSNRNQNVTFTATVTHGGNRVPSGTVTFKEGNTVLAGPTAVNASGQASFSKSNLSPGDHVITAVYNGTANYQTSSGTVTQTVRR